jgi:hypothetical protein
LKSVTIGDGVTTIGDYAFSGCNSLDSFAFGSKVETIGQEAFSDCVNVKSLSSKAVAPPVCGTQALDDINKWDCTLYVSLESSDEYSVAEQWKEFFFVKEVDVTVYSGTCIDKVYYDLDNYTLEATMTFEGETYDVSEEYTGDVVIPDVVAYAERVYNVTAIANNAFNGCDQVASITCMSTTPPVVGANAFAEVDKSIPIYVPTESVEAYKSAKGWEAFTNILAIDEKPNAVTDVEIGNVSIRLIGNRLTVEGVDDYAVYAISGQSLGKVESLERGVYVVVADGESKKIVVK